MAVFLVILLYTTTQLGFHSFVDGSVAEVASLGFGRGKIWCANHARNFVCPKFCAGGGGGGGTGKGSCPKWHHYGLFVANSGARTMPEILRFRVPELCPKFCAWGWAHVNHYKMLEKVTCKISGAIRAHRSAKFRAWFGQWFFRPFIVEWISDVW